jgi:hypothetical protein
MYILEDYNIYKEKFVEIFMSSKKVKIIGDYNEFRSVKPGELISIRGSLELVVDPVHGLDDIISDRGEIYTLSTDGRFVTESKYIRYLDIPDPEWEEEYLTPIVKNVFQISGSEDCRDNTDKRLTLLIEGGLIK